VGNGRRQPSSLRDRSGFLFTRDGRPSRQVKRSCQPDYRRLIDSGLYREFVDRGLLVAHRESSEPPADPAPAFTILEPARIPSVSRPYEWCFGQLKRPALRTTLEVQKRALARGLPLKAASAFHIQLRGHQPVLDDRLPFPADIFDDYHEQGLERAFAGAFRIISRQPIRESSRVLYLMERR
jgi:hypothetical protein